MILGSSAQFAVPYVVGIVIDEMTKASEGDVELDWYTINYWTVGMAIVVVISSVFIMVRAATFNIIAEKISLHLKYDLFYFMINKDTQFFDETKVGDMLSRISSDTTIIQDGLSTNVSMFTRSMLFIIITIVILMLTSWKLSLVTIGGIIPVIFFIRVNGYFTKEYTKQIQTEKANIGSISEEAISCVRTVKAFSTEHVEIARFNKANEKVYDLGMKVAYFNGALGTLTSACL